MPADMLVALLLDGELTIHGAGATGDYATLCGLDGDDAMTGQAPAELPKRGKINCDACRQIWTAAKALRRSDFE